MQTPYGGNQLFYHSTNTSLPSLHDKAIVDMGHDIYFNNRWIKCEYLPKRQVMAYRLSDDITYFGPASLDFEPFSLHDTLSVYVNLLPAILSDEELRAALISNGVHSKLRLTEIMQERHDTILEEVHYPEIPIFIPQLYQADAGAVGFLRTISEEHYPDIGLITAGNCFPNDYLHHVFEQLLTDFRDAEINKFCRARYWLEYYRGWSQGIIICNDEDLKRIDVNRHWMQIYGCD